jgi:hypothetical protein
LGLSFSRQQNSLEVRIEISGSGEQSNGQFGSQPVRVRRPLTKRLGTISKNLWRSLFLVPR